MSSKRRPVLMTDLAAAGTLAAVRSLGGAGIPVTVVDFGLLKATRWSRFATEYWACPSVAGKVASFDALKRWADRSSGHVLFATSDETAWLYARYADEIKKTILVYTPSLETVETILDKERLWFACLSVNIPTLPTWFPRDEGEAKALAPDLPYPLLIKPRTHVFRDRRDKGSVVDSHQALQGAYAGFLHRERGKASFENSGQKPPLLQQFVVEAVENVISVSGFIDRSGTRSVIRASRKILQRSRPVGIGLAFEAIDVDPALAEAAIALCKRVGYFGVFEMEFVAFDGVWRLIDFNPRFFHQMGLDIQSGAPLPLFAYFDACGELACLDQAIATCAEMSRTELGFSDTFTVPLTVALRSLVDRATPRDLAAWYWSKRGRLVDATFDWRDPLPALVHAMSELRLGFAALPRVAQESKNLRRLIAFGAPLGRMA
jgi:D-aspartate ligase